MPRVCTVCASPALVAINRALLTGTSPIAQLASEHRLSRQSLMRHKADHLPKAAAAAMQRERQETQEGAEASVLDEIRRLGKTAQAMMGNAWQSGDKRTAAVFLESARRCLETQAKCLGQISEGTTVINFTTNVEFRAITVKLVAALADHPEARQKVLEALAAEDDVGG